MKSEYKLNNFNTLNRHLVGGFAYMAYQQVSVT